LKEQTEEYEDTPTYDDEDDEEEISVLDRD
jgi:hypothetical protein